MGELAVTNPCYNPTLFTSLRCATLTCCVTNQQPEGAQLKIKTMGVHVVWLGKTAKRQQLLGCCYCCEGVLLTSMLTSLFGGGSVTVLLYIG